MGYRDMHGLTFAAMLSDPMIQAVMHSDGVSMEEFSRLMFRMRATVMERDGAPRPLPRRPAPPAQRIIYLPAAACVAAAAPA